MPPEAQVTGLVLHFRTPQRTLACLRSLHDEGISKVVVVDNSEDGGQSLAAMTEDLETLREAGLRSDLLRPPNNLGFAAGVGLGLEHTRQTDPTHVLLINSDACLEIGALAAMVSELPGSGIVAPMIHSEAGTSSPIHFYQRWFGLLLQCPRLLAVRYPSGCCLLIRKDHVRNDLFDRDFFFYGEDMLLGYELACVGVILTVCARASVWHAVSASARNGSWFYEYHMVRAHWLLARKLARNRVEHTLFVAGRCLTLPARALVRSLRTRTLTPCNALLRATTDVVRGRRHSYTPALD